MKSHRIPRGRRAGEITAADDEAEMLCADAYSHIMQNSACRAFIWQHVLIRLDAVMTSVSRDRRPQSIRERAKICTAATSRRIKQSA